MTRGSLVIQTAFLGDVILTTPLLSELATRGPVDAVTTPAAAPLLARHPAVREVMIFDKRGSARGLRGLADLARTLRARRYDTAYLAQASLRSGALALMARVPHRVGFATAAGRHLYTRRVDYRDDLHHAERLLRLALPPDAPPVARDTLRPSLFPADEDERAAAAVLRESGIEDTRPVVLAPGSVWATKRWPYFAELAARLAPELPVLIIGTAADRSLADEILSAVRRVGGIAVDVTGRLSLLGSVALLRHALALVTNDSAPLHLASATGTPTLAIFGPTVPDFGFGPLAERSIVVGREALPCRPCDRHGPQRCPLSHWRCMRELTPDDIAAAVRTLVSHPDS